MNQHPWAVIADIAAQLISMRQLPHVRAKPYPLNFAFNADANTVVHSRS